MAFTCVYRSWTTTALLGIFLFAAAVSLPTTDATLPIPFIGGGNGATLIPGIPGLPLNLLNTSQLKTLQRDLNRASSFLTHYANAHAQETVDSLSQGRLPPLPLANLVLGQLGQLGGGAAPGNGGGGSNAGSGGILGGLGNLFGSGLGGGGGGSAAAAPLPPGPVTVTAEDVQKIKDQRKAAAAAAGAPPGGAVKAGPVTVTLDDLAAAGDGAGPGKAGPVTVTLDDLAAAGDGTGPDTRGVRAIGRPFNMADDRSGDFTQLSNGLFQGCARSFAPLYQLLFCGRRGLVNPPGIREILRLVNIALGVNQ